MIVDNRIRVLVIDDSQVIRQTLESVLSQEGAVVLTAGSVEEALGVRDRFQPHVVLLDTFLSDGSARASVGLASQLVDTRVLMMSTEPEMARLSVERLWSADNEAQLPEVLDKADVELLFARLREIQLN